MPNFNKLHILFSVESKEVVLLAFLNITNIKKLCKTVHPQHMHNTISLHYIYIAQMSWQKFYRGLSYNGDLQGKWEATGANS